MARIKIPQEIGSIWKGDKYSHGPRLVDPKKCESFRLGKLRKNGVRIVWCKLKNGSWVMQSKLAPRKKK